jgi:hypothetical protein
MAGTWVAYQLAKAGVETILISYGDGDRGGVQGASRRSAGALSLLPTTEKELDTFLQRLGRNQTHPSVAPALSRYFAGALEELRTLLKLKPVCDHDDPAVRGVGWSRGEWMGDTRRGRA